VSTAFSSTQFSVAPHGKLQLIAAFNGSTSHGGDNMGPVVAAPMPTKLNQALNVTTTSIKFISRDSNGLTSRAIYLFTVTNPNAFHVSFVVSYFFD
jgi:hypothetical protein